MSEQFPSLSSLLDQVNKLTKNVSDKLKSLEIAEPSMAPDSQKSYNTNPELFASRMQLYEALQKMQQLVLGPAEWIDQICVQSRADVMIFHVFFEFDVFLAVPTQGSASVEEISKKTNLPQSGILRLMRYAVTLNVFNETELGSNRFIHTAVTRYIVDNYQKVKVWNGLNCELLGSSFQKTSEALRSFALGKTEMPSLPGQTAIALAQWNPEKDPSKFDKTMFDYMNTEENVEKKLSERFAQGMNYSSKLGGIQAPDLLKHALDWNSLGDATVIDVGGSLGHNCYLLAKLYPRLSCIIQDKAELKPAFEANLPKDLVGRLKFEAHNFFDPQKRQANVFIFSRIFHDWADVYSAKILNQLKPVLRNGDRILIIDGVLPELKVDDDIPMWHIEESSNLVKCTQETRRRILSVAPLKRSIYFWDIMMLVGLNSLERTPTEWKALLQKVGPEFRIANIKLLGEKSFGLVEVIYQD